MKGRSNANRNLRKILAVNAKLNSTLDLDPLLDIIMTTAAEVILAKAASLLLIDKAANELVFKVALGSKGGDLKENFRIQMGEGIAGTVAQTGKSLIVNAPRKDKRFAQRFDAGTGFQTQAILCVPLHAKGKRIGVLEAINPVGRTNFTQDDLKLFEIFADQAATAIDNARLHGEIIKQEQVKQELKIAHKIQQNFLPDLARKHFNVSVSARNIPAREVGGDFYDCINLDGGRTGIVIGDVSGKGVPAALFMVRAISEYRFLIPRSSGPAELLTLLNNRIAQDSPLGMFVTLLDMVFDSRNQLLHYASAGHHPILHRKSSSGEVLALENVGGLPVGIAESREYQQGVVPFHQGDAFCVYTDGIIEARNAAGSEYSIERLKKVFRQPQTSATVYTEEILRDLERFSAGCDQHDDITVLTAVIP